MAKRIIKNGKYNTAICTDCGCEFAFDTTDIEKDNKTIVCPQCDTIITLKDVKSN